MWVQPRSSQRSRGDVDGRTTVAVKLGTSVQAHLGPSRGPIENHGSSKTSLKYHTKNCAAYPTEAGAALRAFSGAPWYRQIQTEWRIR